MLEEEIKSEPVKKVKLNLEQQQNDQGWIVIKKKTTPLTISIADHSKVNRFYSHKSIQKYIRYLFTETCPNPMWLSIKRQSQIEHIYYIDIEIEDYSFEKMLEENNLQFLSSKISSDCKGVFRQQQFNRCIWQSLFVYDQQQKLAKQELLSQPASLGQTPKMSLQTYKKYSSSLLTPSEMKQNLYPEIKLPLYSSYSCIFTESQLSSFDFLKAQINQSNQQKYQNKNVILVIDCEMVMTTVGLELARCTIVNYEEQIVFDQFFKPKNQILNYNTQFSGITQEILNPITNTIENVLHPFLIKFITQESILIGHSLENDFNAMQFFHPKVIDTSVLFKKKNGSKMKLKFLANKILNRKIQQFTHDSKEDCLATLHLVQARLSNQKLFNVQKQYHLLRDLIKTNQSVLIVDYDIDNLCQYNSVHFEKIQRYENSEKICSIIKKYSNKTLVSVPKTVFTRFEKDEAKEWQIYYKEMDHSIQKLFTVVPAGTVFFLNFQVNQLVRIVPFFAEDNRKQRLRPFFVAIPKN